MDDARIEFSRQRSSAWNFPAYEQVADTVKGIDIQYGRQSERDKFMVGTCNIELEVDRDNMNFVVDYDEPAYVNGFSAACSDYLSTREESLTIFAGSDATFEGPFAPGTVQLLLPRLSSDHAWRLGPDVAYLAEVDEHVQYVPSFALQEINGRTEEYPLIADIHWFSESLGFLGTKTFYEANVPVDVETRVHGLVTAPSGARYAALGASAFTQILSDDFHLRFSKFMIHEYDKAYNIEHGTALKPFAIGDLYGKAPNVSTPMRVFEPGSQFKIKDYPRDTIGSDSALRDVDTIFIQPPLYNMETFTAGNVASYFFQNRVTRSVITTDSIEGTQCVRAQTDATGTGTHALYLAPSNNTLNVAVEPGKQYRFAVSLKNKGLSAATFSLLVRDSGGSTTTVLANQSIGATSGWITYIVSWVAPTNVRSAMMIIQFAAAGYDIYVDRYRANAVSGKEPARGYNYLNQIGDFEQVNSSYLYNFCAKSPGANVKRVNDNTASAPSGSKFMSIDKPAGGTTQYIVWGSNLEHSVAQVEGTRAYRYKVTAKKTTAAATSMWLGVRFNDTISGASHDYTYQVALTDNWTDYARDFIVPASASGVSLTLVINGASADVCQAYVDDVYLTRVPVEMIEELSSLDEASLTRTTVYQVDCPENNGYIFMIYGNDLLEDSSLVLKWQHSGKTRTRYKATVEHVGYDLPVGTEVYLLPIGTNGQKLLHDEGLASRAYVAVPCWDQAQLVTMPTADNPSVELNMLAPDIPWRAWTFALVFVLPKGSHKIGYKFINEYIGPDGYENAPGTNESVHFIGHVESRDDAPNSIAIDGRRVYPASFTCIDKSGALATMKMLSPYPAIVKRDSPIAYLPLNGGGLSEIAGRLGKAPKMLTAGIPDEWGIEYDGQKTLVGLADNEGGSYKFTPQTIGASSNSGQLVKLDDPAMQPSPGRGSSVGVWFSHEAALGDKTETIFYQSHSRISVSNRGRGVYIQLHANGIYAGVFAGTSVTGYANLATDGLPHYVVVAHDGDAASIYIDGVLVRTDNVLTHHFDTTYIGGEYLNGQFSNMFNGHIGQVEVYDYALSSAEVWQHWKQGKNLRKGDDELARIEHILNLAQQGGTPPIVRDREGNIPETVTTLGAPNWKAGSTPLDLMNSVADSVGGQVYAGPGGHIIYENREQRFNYGGESNQSWLIGEGSEIIPESDIGVSHNTDKLINEAVITLADAEEDEGGIQAFADKRSIRDHTRFSYEKTLNLETPEQGKYMAQWLVNTNKEPYARFSALTFSYNASPETAEFCKKVRVGDHVHGDIGLDNGAGVVDGFVESVTHSTSKIGSLADWTVTVELSPAHNQLVAELDHDTYGILNGEYRLGY